MYVVGHRPVGFSGCDTNLRPLLMCRLVTARREGEINILNGSVSPPLKSVIDWGEMQENVVKNVMRSAQKTMESKSPKYGH